MEYWWGFWSGATNAFLTVSLIFPDHRHVTHGRWPSTRLPSRAHGRNSQLRFQLATPPSAMSSARREPPSYLRTGHLLPGESVPRGRIYPLSLPEQKAMEEYIEDALQQGYIRPSTSPAALSFFFVSKKDGGLRPCIDYRALNKITVKFRYPLPLVPAALEHLREPPSSPSWTSAVHITSSGYARGTSGRLPSLPLLATTSIGWCRMD